MRLHLSPLLGLLGPHQLEVIPALLKFPLTFVLCVKHLAFPAALWV